MNNACNVLEENGFGNELSEITLNGNLKDGNIFSIVSKMANKQAIDKVTRQLPF